MEEVALVHLEAQDVGRDSQVVTGQVTLTMTKVWLSLRVRPRLSSEQPHGFIETGDRLQHSCIGNACRAMRGLVY